MVEHLIIKYNCLTARDNSEQIEINTACPYTILCHHVESGCEICSQAFVGGTERTPSCRCTESTGHYQR
ncbi:hypothetical protein TNCV_3670491 [Trichonephila clavipes]|nr:hypothetical protein TNCV_3670491 [Trichonephila clavipes]